MTGPNGFGKSTIINCMNAIGNSNLEFFVELNLGCYRKEDFKETELYHALNTYQANRNLKFVD